jgi:hypothetical protein
MIRSLKDGGELRGGEDKNEMANHVIFTEMKLKRNVPASRGGRSEAKGVEDGCHVEFTEEA